ncbi:threonine synthase [Ferroacidibacillus organovorans]|uniref:Threonine synthase n=1 Tax=Ferroacidibacillus organovorans TaxID=1765683 RepID=A0A101XP43_9BACL|nr:threonine synthase [Ferroacidibacillus organovorans]KUO94962.1 threonine synthase [Ferroacidibacillus organovorans]
MNQSTEQSKRSGILARFAKDLPVTDKTPSLSLCEGDTPLIPAPYLSERVQAQVYLKYEGANPTGSFKDRGMVMAIAKAIEEGSQAVICASTGNTSAAAAAYAARAGLRCVVIIPAGYVALGKLAQALAYGAEVISIAGNFDEALTIVRDVAASEPITLVNSVNPYRLQGQKTAAFELVETLGKAPDYLAIPVGNAGNISAYHMGFVEWDQARQSGVPHMLGFQAAGAAPIVSGHIVEKPDTIATAIRIGNPASWQLANRALADSRGAIAAVTDEEILDAYRLLAKREGVFAEPASAAPIAGILKRATSLPFSPDDKIVCVLTGNGLKDPDTAVSSQRVATRTVEASRNAVWRAIVEGKS